MSVCMCVHECVWRDEEKKKEERMLVQERLFIYVAIYLNKVYFLNCLLFDFFKAISWKDLLLC